MYSSLQITVIVQNLGYVLQIIVLSNYTQIDITAPLWAKSLLIYPGTGVAEPGQYGSLPPAKLPLLSFTMAVGWIPVVVKPTTGPWFRMKSLILEEDRGFLLWGWDCDGWVAWMNAQQDVAETDLTPWTHHLHFSQPFSSCWLMFF